MKSILKMFNRSKNSLKNSLRSNERGLTFAELLIVLVVLGVIMGIVYSRLRNVWDNQKLEATKLTMRNLFEPLEIYKGDNGDYPETEQGLEALVAAPATGSFPNYRPGGYIDQKKLKDAWNNSFVYQKPGKDEAGYDVISYGKDGKPGGDGFNADIYSSSLK